jgi:hypothetical protein
VDVTLGTQAACCNGCFVCLAGTCLGTLCTAVGGLEDATHLPLSVAGRFRSGVIKSFGHRLEKLAGVGEPVGGV